MIFSRCAASCVVCAARVSRGVQREESSAGRLPARARHISQHQTRGPPVLAMTGYRKVVWGPLVAAAAAAVLMCGVPLTRAAIYSDKGLEVRAPPPPIIRHHFRLPASWTNHDQTAS